MSNDDTEMTNSYRRVASTPGTMLDFVALNLPLGDEGPYRGANDVGLLS